MPTKEKENKEILLLTLVGAVSSFSFIFARVAVTEFHPLLIAIIRTIGGGSLVVMYGKASGEEIKWRGNWLPLFVLGTLNFAAPFVLFSYSARVIPGAYSAVLNALAPAISALLTWLILDEYFGTAKIFGLLLGIAGVTIISLEGLGNTAAISGILFCLAGAAAYAMGAVYTKIKALKLNIVSIAGAAQLIAGITLLPFAINIEVPTKFTLYPMLSLVLLVIINSALAYVLYFAIVTKSGPTKALTITFIAPVFTGIWGYFLLSESPSVDFLIGSSAIALSVFITTRHPPQTLEKKNVFKAL